MKTNDTKLTSRATKNYRELLLSNNAELQDALQINSYQLAEPRDETTENLGPVVQGETVTLHLNRILYGQLREVKSALAKIESGSYGLCEDCGEPISEKRLQAAPWASYCIACQERRGASRTDA